MTSLGKKLGAEQKLRTIVNDIASDNIDESTAHKLNELFSVFGSRYVLEKKGTHYKPEDAKELYETCLAILKKEYTAKFMGDMALTQMLQEDDT